ncbi:MAG: YwbE family protein [Bacteroidetes bacterium]|nr:YwbE family protein [Bacteroidota bacterium]MBT3749885.1 YwbE family protein [Bacteroidota bacterium]MBT4399952.1 YwbE family protein [Bacteroidota bacterium]MBT4412172.1 YwbE family protein [Bacteroidota bacterium]MBT5427546.1 YwbE family protein [Bacteroidota bacterium]
MSDRTKRNTIQVGDLVEIVQKQHQGSGELTEGIVKRLLTKSASHPHGIKVLLATGEVGRVKNIID